MPAQPGTGTPTFTFKQTDETSTGRHKSNAYGEGDLSGIIQGRMITFGYVIDIPGKPIKMKTSFSGTVERLSRVIASVLCGIPPTDAVTFLTGPLILTIVMLAACALPARVGGQIQPRRRTEKE